MAAAGDPPPASVRARRSAHDPGMVLLILAGRFTRADATRLGARVHAMLDRRPATTIVCDVGGVADPDAAVVDCLCRMRLAARRHGCLLEIRAAPVALQELLYLTGLTNVLPVRQGRTARTRRRGAGAARTAGTSARCRGRT